MDQKKIWTRDVRLPLFTQLLTQVAQMLDVCFGSKADTRPDAKPFVCGTNRHARISPKELNV